jgi:plastocyanin
MRSAAGFAAVALVMAACSRPPAETAVTSPPTPQAQPPANGAATVSGKTARSSAIVVLDPKKPAAETPAPTPVMDQIQLTFIPDFLMVRTGKPVEFRNSDDTLHNVHVDNTDTREAAFNVAIPTGEKYSYTFPKDGFYRVACDIHPAMSAQIFAASTPFMTVADAAGTFDFYDVPPGAYVVRVFAGGTTLQREVEIKSGANEIRVE